MVLDGDHDPEAGLCCQKERLEVIIQGMRGKSFYELLIQGCKVIVSFRKVSGSDSWNCLLRYTEECISEGGVETFIF